MSLSRPANLISPGSAARAVSGSGAARPPGLFANAAGLFQAAYGGGKKDWWLSAGLKKCGWRCLFVLAGGVGCGFELKWVRKSSVRTELMLRLVVKIAKMMKLYFSFVVLFVLD